jgi:hypothetical protein
MYFGSVIVLVAYSVLYGLTARKARWLGGVTSAAVIILGELVLQCIISFPIALSLALPFHGEGNGLML